MSPTTWEPLLVSLEPKTKDGNDSPGICLMHKTKIRDIINHILLIYLLRNLILKSQYSFPVTTKVQYTISRNEFLFNAAYGDLQYV